MKGIIRWLLGHVPRSLMQRVADICVPILGLLYVGRGRECPICGAKRRKFLPYGYVVSRESALCPNCLSLERHRLLWLYLMRETTLANERGRILHIAPEVCIKRRLKKMHSDGNYITADLESPLADMHFDVQDIPLEDGFARVVICNHIMEHVEDDILAMRELRRILSPSGWGIILSPVERDREHTFEDDTIVDEAERTRIFGQYDHRRIYGLDYADRLRTAGFKVEEIDYITHFTPEEKHLYSLNNEIIYRVSTNSPSR